MFSLNIPVKRGQEQWYLLCRWANRGLEEFINSSELQNVRCLAKTLRFYETHKVCTWVLYIFPKEIHSFHSQKVCWSRNDWEAQYTSRFSCLTSLIILQTWDDRKEFWRVILNRQNSQGQETKMWRERKWTQTPEIWSKAYFFFLIYEWHSRLSMTHLSKA